MDVLDAAYHTGRKYKGGIEALALRLGHPNLSDELNVNRPNAKLGLATAVDMMVMADDYGVLNAICAATGHFPPLRMPAEVQPAGACMETLARMAQEFADVVATVSATLADNKITDNELAASLKEWRELLAQGQLLMQQLSAMNALLKDGAPGEAK